MPEPVFDPRCLRLVALLRQRDFARAEDLVRTTLDQQSPERVYVHVLIPAVFLLGEQFVEGLVSPAELPQALNCVYSLLEIARERLVQRPPLGRRAFCAYLPGEAHSVGMIAIVHWLRRDGWEIDFPFPPPAEKPLIGQILESKPTFIALSCAVPRSVVSARRVIRALRECGCKAPIWVGGTPINTVPGLFERTGADHTARDIVSFTQALAKVYGYETGTPADLM